jgi:hypothetical protein
VKTEKKTSHAREGTKNSFPRDTAKKTLRDEKGRRRRRKRGMRSA